MRTFRIDRVRGADVTGEEFELVASVSPDTAVTAFAPEGLPVARLRFSAGEPFVEREWPGGRVVSEEPDGATIAEVPFAGTGWIARRVVARLGAVEVLEPAEIRAAVAEIARRS
jgi:predicted DNA-binding transcriptional regulator YafY